jgi:hypothetical protein
MKLIAFILLLSIVLACPNNCNDCDPTATVCFACAEGFELSVLGTCVDSATVPKCNLYGPTNQCFSCQSTYTINNGQCLKDYSACLAYDPSDDTKCITCSFGTVLKNNACTGTINCNSTTPGACTSCISGFKLKNGICSDSTGNCVTVGSNGVCTTCVTGFSLVGYSCLNATLKVYGCYVFDVNSVCQLCKAGYNLYQGSCLLPSQIQQIQQGLTQLSSILASRSTVSVTTTTTTTTTTTAAGSADQSSGFGSGFSSFGGFGLDNSSSFGGFGGGSFGGSSSSFGGGSFGGGSFGGATTGSFGGFGSTTTVTIANCQAYDPANPGNCIACNSGYYTTGAACLQVSIFCATYNSQNGACLTCNYGFPLLNGQCNDPNCLSQTVNGCSVCRANFALNANSYCQLNDQYCAKATTSLCLQCISGYFVGNAGTCVQLPANCISANPNTLACSNCASGFQVGNNGACVQVSSTVTTFTTSTTTSSTVTIPFCASQSGLICNQCLNGYQLSNNQCYSSLPVNCQTADPSHPGSCLTCLSGYTLNNGACVQSQSPSTPYCQSYNLLTGQCIACLSGYNLSGVFCTPVNLFNGNSGSSSSSSSSTTTSTTTTNSGSSSSSGGVVVISGGAVITNRDPNCAKYVNVTCAQCSNRYYFSSSSLCIPVNPLCNNYNSNGGCLSCYPGYALYGANCIVSKQQDPFCKSFNQGGVCIQCYTGYFFNQVQSLCQQLNSLCKTSNLTDGTCLSCFPGYNLNAGICAVSFQDPNCQKFDSTRNICTACSTKFYIDTTGKCRQISPLCKTADSNTGYCLSCYPGYILVGATCSVGGNSNSDVNCQTFTNNICQKCYSGYFLSSKGICAQNNPLCKTSDPATGNCLTCYPGYSINAGNCTIGSSSTTSTDTNCKSTDQNGVCTACYSGYYLTPGMNCQKMDPLCKSYTAALSACATCYDGYTLSNGQCLISSQVTSANSDPYCIKSQGSNCLSCAGGYYLPPSGTCTQLNPLCKDSDLTNGNCLNCYPGYTLSSNTCIVAAAVNIPYCSQVVGSSCASCINGYYVSNGACSLVNVLCGTYDQSSGVCLSCIPGYVFQAGQCILPSLGIDPNCAQYTNSYCTQCSSGYALVSYWCNPIDPYCTQYNPTTNTCTACNQGKTPQGPSCV